MAPQYKYATATFITEALCLVTCVQLYKVKVTAYTLLTYPYKGGFYNRESTVSV